MLKLVTFNKHGGEWTVETVIGHILCSVMGNVLGGVEGNVCGGVGGYVGGKVRGLEEEE